MATTPMRQMLALMADPAIRGANAADAVILIFSADLSALLWANSAAAASFDLDLTGRQDSLPENLRGQISASRSLLARKGRAAVRLRPSGMRQVGIHGQLEIVSLTATTRNAATDEVAVLTAKAPRPAYGPADRDAALLREAGLDSEDAARLVATEDAATLLENSNAPAADAIAAFVAGNAGLTEIAGGPVGRLLLVKLVEDRIVAIPIEGDADETVLSHEPPLPDGSPAPEGGDDASSSAVGMPKVDKSPASGRIVATALRSNWGSTLAATLPVSERVPAGDDEPRESKEASRPGLMQPDAGDEDIAPLEDEAAVRPASVDALPFDGGTVPEEAATDLNERSPAEPVPEVDGSTDIPQAETSPDQHPQTDVTPTKGRSARRHTDWGTAPQQPLAATDGEGPTDTAASEATIEPNATSDRADPDGSEDADGEDEKSAPEVRLATTADFPIVPDDGGEPRVPSDFSPQVGGEPARFVWRVDRDGRFRSLSPEFAAAVGPESAAILERTVEEVARAYRLDGDGALRRLFARRETWSGRTVMWPLETTTLKVPVDLAALPIYARDRSFDGFRGFGVVRLSDTENDPDAIGLAPAEAFLRAKAAPEPEALPGNENSDESHMPAFMRTIAAGPTTSFGRRDPEQRPTPGYDRADPQEATPSASKPGDKIIRLEERRRPQNGNLSQTEEAAFRAIGETLAQGSDPRDLVGAVRAASERIDAIEGQRTADLLAEDQLTGGEDAADRSGASGERAFDADVAAALEQAYGSLPLPILAQAGDDLVYANREFLDLTGHDDVAALREAGGLEGLVLERRQGDADCLRLKRANGQPLAIRARMQRTSVAGVGCLILSFFATPRLAVLSRDLTEAAAEEPSDTVIRGVFDNPVLDLAADGIVLLDDSGLITAMSGAAQQLFDVPAGDVAGRPFLTLFAHESQKGLKPILDGTDTSQNAAIAGQGKTKWYARRDVIGRVADGGFAPLSVSLGRVPGTSGFCAVIHDITTWKRAEETADKARAHAEASNLQKSTFLSEVANEIRDPVDAMIGFADLMGSETLGPVGNERYLEYLGDIKRSGHQVIDLVTILHDLARVETGRRELTFEAVSLAEIVAEVTAVMAPQANRNRVIVRTHLPSSVPPVVADHDTIRQVTTNLVADSIRATPAGGQLIVSIKHDAETGVTLRFRDSGVGMRQDEIDTALKVPGSSAAASGAESGRLGLSLTKALAEANRADFSISSTPGEGTLVEVSFPPSRVLLD